MKYVFVLLIISVCSCTKVNSQNNVSCYWVAYNKNVMTNVVKCVDDKNVCYITNSGISCIHKL